MNVGESARIRYCPDADIVHTSYICILIARETGRGREGKGEGEGERERGREGEREREKVCVRACVSESERTVRYGNNGENGLSYRRTVVPLCCCFSSTGSRYGVNFRSTWLIIKDHDTQYFTIDY